LLLASIVLSNIIFFKYIGNSHEYGFYGAIFWSDLLLLAASYMELLPSVLRQIRRVSVSDPPLATASPETSVFG
jgi:hypothetical protein